MRSCIKILKEIVLIEPMKVKLVQGVYIRWMVVELKSKNDHVVHTTGYSKITKMLLAIIAKETSYSANVGVNSR